MGVSPRPKHRRIGGQCPQSPARGPAFTASRSVAQAIDLTCLGRRRVEVRQLAERAHDDEAFDGRRDDAQILRRIVLVVVGDEIAQLAGVTITASISALRRSAVGQRVEHRAAPRVERERREAGAADRRLDPHRPGGEVEAADRGGERRIGPGKAPLAGRGARQRRGRPRRPELGEARVGVVRRDDRDEQHHGEMDERRRRGDRRDEQRRAAETRARRSCAAFPFDGRQRSSSRCRRRWRRAASRRGAAPARSGWTWPIGSQLPEWASAET